jgi:hypothetical protein
MDWKDFKKKYNHKFDAKLIRKHVGLVSDG